YVATMVALFRLRSTRPDLERPYKCWGYPVVPGVFIAVSLGMTALYIAQKPGTTLPWLGVLLLGFPAYTIWTRLGRRSKMPPHE
ncbi:MAG TPA: amino acid transporter, partial [Planctomycetota bacterium]|nr:amino acid transporter [Planctomycetota bacterium]